MKLCRLIRYSWVLHCVGPSVSMEESIIEKKEKSFNYQMIQKVSAILKLAPFTLPMKYHQRIHCLAASMSLQFLTKPSAAFIWDQEVKFRTNDFRPENWDAKTHFFHGRFASTLRGSEQHSGFESLKIYKSTALFRQYPEWPILTLTLIDLFEVPFVISKNQFQW